MQTLHSKVSMAMFCGEVAQRYIFILGCGGARPVWCGGALLPPASSECLDESIAGVKLPRQFVGTCRD